jgi:hypothetical protein
MIWQNAKVRAFGFAWPCTKTSAVNAHPHSPSTARLAIEFITSASTFRASSPLWLHPFMHPATGVAKQKKMWTFPSPTMCSARGAVDSGRGTRAFVRFRHAHAKIRWLFRALLPAAHAAPAISLHTPFVDSSVSKKVTKEPLSWRVRFFFTALRSPVALCIAGGRRCCSLAPLALSRRAPFFWLAGQILVKKISSVFFGKKTEQIMGVIHPPR